MVDSVLQDAPPPKPASPAGRRPNRWRNGPFVVILLVVITGLVLVFTKGINRPTKDEPRADVFPVPALQPEPRSDVPSSGLAAPRDRPNMSDAAELTSWAAQVGAVTKIEPRVISAYGRAEMWMRSERPNCRVTWTTLAGIGRVESRHGTIFGSSIDEAGNTTKSIVGPALDGSSGVRAIHDTEGGALDGDTTWDRAVGPMQFLPTTWKRWAIRAYADGQPANPQNIDDAALTAARYLCSQGGNLSTPNDWWNAVLTYNQSVSYAQDVFSGAQAYGLAVPAS